MNNIYMRFPGGRAKALTLSYDDGVQQDHRLISILNRHGIKCTFNINSGLFPAEGTTFPPGQIHRRLTEQEAVALYTDSGHEVAVHSLTHPFLEQLPPPLVVNEIAGDRKNLERLFHTIIRGMAYPFGTYSDEVVTVLRSAGIVYSRTVESTEDFRVPSDWLRLPATCHHDSPRLGQLTDKFITETPGHGPWLFYLWGHSYEFEANDNWKVIEDFSKAIGGKEDIWYATNIQVYDYIQAFRALHFSMDAGLVHNPSAVPVFFVGGLQSYAIQPGETLQL